VSALKIRVEWSHFVLIILMCSLKLEAGSSVRPKIFGFRMVGITTSLMIGLSLTLCSCVSDVKSVEEDLVGFSIYKVIALVQIVYVLKIFL